MRDDTSANEMSTVMTTLNTGVAYSTADNLMQTYLGYDTTPMRLTSFDLMKKLLHDKLNNLFRLDHRLKNFL